MGVYSVFFGYTFLANMPAPSICIMNSGSVDNVHVQSRV